MDGLQALGILRRVARTGLQVRIERLGGKDSSLTVRRDRHERTFEQLTARDVGGAILAVDPLGRHESDRGMPDDALSDEGADLLRPRRRREHATSLEHVPVIERGSPPDRVMEVMEGMERDRLRERLERLGFDDLAIPVERLRRQDDFELPIRVLTGDGLDLCEGIALLHAPLLSLMSALRLDRSPATASDSVTAEMAASDSPSHT